MDGVNLSPCHLQRCAIDRFLQGFSLLASKLVGVGSSPVQDCTTVTAQVTHSQPTLSICINYASVHMKQLQSMFLTDVSSVWLKSQTS